MTTWTPKRTSHAMIITKRYQKITNISPKRYFSVSFVWAVMPKLRSRKGYHWPETVFYLCERVDGSALRRLPRENHSKTHAQCVHRSDLKGPDGHLERRMRLHNEWKWVTDSPIQAAKIDKFHDRIDRGTIPRRDESIDRTKITGISREILI